MKTIQTFRTTLELGQITYSIEVTATAPEIAQAKFALLEKFIRNGAQKEIILSEPEVVTHDTKNVTKKVGE